MSILKAKQLTDGASFTVISPASEIASFPRRTKRGLNALVGLGYTSTLAPNALMQHGRDAGSPQERANDIMRAFTDSRIDAMICSTGGYTSISVLEHLDYLLIADHPKIIIGHSDNTAILLALYGKSKLVTFHGPTLLPSFGDAGGVHTETATWFKRTLTHTCDRLDFPSGFENFSDDELYWDKEDDLPRGYTRDTGALCLYPGEAEGRLLGGNLDTLLALLPTPWCPSFKGSILFIEEIGGSTSKTLRGLATLEAAGVFGDVTGLVIGRRFKYADSEGLAGIAEAFREIGRRYRFPILDNFPFGHTEPKLTLPIGVLARLDAESRLLSLMESAVRIG